MHFGILDEPNSAVSRLLASRQQKVLLEETGNQPNVYYLI
jgi:Fe-S-cluster-containing dehydrogenase component